jgi:hypothetical protein
VVGYEAVELQAGMPLQLPDGATVGVGLGLVLGVGLGVGLWLGFGVGVGVTEPAIETVAVALLNCAVALVV